MPELNSLSLKNDANLQGYWRMEDNWNDTSSNAYNLTAINSPTFVTGIFNKAGNFVRASSQYSSIAGGSCPNLNITTSQTWIAWCNPASFTGGAVHTILGKKSGTDLNSLHIDGAATTVAILLAGLSASVASDILVSLNIWNFIAGRYNSSTNKLAIFLGINGTLVKKEASVTGSVTSNAGEFRLASLGSSPNENFYDGIIDDCSIFNRALTDGEINTIFYNTGGSFLYNLI